MRQLNWRFDGSDYKPNRDNVRLSSQLTRVFSVMQDSEWRTLEQIAVLTGDPEASISAQLRHLRKKRFGAHRVDKIYQGGGLYIYRLIPSGNLPPRQVENKRSF